MDLSDLDDKQIQEKIEKFHGSVDKIEGFVNKMLDEDVYNTLSSKEKVDYDLFAAYTLNTLYWLYLRSKGINPIKNQVKDELTRIRQYMLKAKQAHERNTIRPKIDQAVAGRFIKHNVSHGQKRKRENGDD